MPASAQTAAMDAVAVGSDFEKGQRQYHRICAQCHGRNMVNSGVTVYDLRRFPLDQPNRFFASVSKGKGNMPSFGEALTAEQMRWLWIYVSSRGKSSQ
jgi:mono/diheme cytochrome c family protein